MPDPDRGGMRVADIDNDGDPDLFRHGRCAMAIGCLRISAMGRFAISPRRREWDTSAISGAVFFGL